MTKLILLVALVNFVLLGDTTKRKNKDSYRIDTIWVIGCKLDTIDFKLKKAMKNIELIIEKLDQDNVKIQSNGK